MSRDNSYWKKRLALEDDETVQEIEEAVIERAAGIEEEPAKDELVFIGEGAKRYRITLMLGASLVACLLAGPA